VQKKMCLTNLNFDIAEKFQNLVVSHNGERDSMKQWSGQEIRQMYKRFFAERGHLVFPSASLVPHDDPTLLWINAGMAPLKAYFDGREIPEKPRIVNSQKCIRTNDIEEVGHTARHQTFFEMLGNFSFGDYFKQEAITWAWEFLTGQLEMDGARLSVTIHTEDDEAFAIWNQEVGIPKERIYRGEDDNFWEIGEGPCGPCSEIFFDRGAHMGCGLDSCSPFCDCDRFLEIWNLVFTQYNKGADGEYTPLPKKNIDTGSGLERLASVLQDVSNNFETDLFTPYIQSTERISGKMYKSSAELDIHFKIIADHLRTVAFAIGDGVLPGNEGRSYIIRRLLRRAVRSGRRLGIDKPFLYQLAPVVAEVMGDDYPEVREKLVFITRVVRTEEERFHETLVEGESLLGNVIRTLKAEGLTEISGEDAFRLYDTYGFPIDLTEEIALEEGVGVNREGFTQELEIQRQRARSARNVAYGMNKDRGVLETITETSVFVGYDQLEATANIIALLRDGDFTEVLQAGESGFVLLDVTPFYAESGGQVADQGEITGPHGTLQVTAVTKAPHGQHLHAVRVVRGHVSKEEVVSATVREATRRDTVKNHTATHLLQKALREVLGTHVAQAGSMVSADRLRFDFSHFGGLSQEELAEVERRVNQEIWQNHPVHIQEMNIDEAKALGAMALFGEKYGSRVRVVQAGESIELCGGCHVTGTGNIGQFLLLSEAGIGSGTRRIEAVTGHSAYQEVIRRTGLLQSSAELLKTTPNELSSRLERVLEEGRRVSRELESAKARLNQNRLGELLTLQQDVQGIPLLATVVADSDMDGLRQIVDALKEKLSSYVIVLGSHTDDKVHFVAAVSKDLQSQGYHAGQLVKEVAQKTGGGGGGRPDMAQAGGKDPAKLEMAIHSMLEIIGGIAGKAKA
jgi:alanyl-tRNA synthetase